MVRPELVCSSCGQTYADRWRCECGGVLDFAEQPLPTTDRPDPAQFDTRDGLWSFDMFIPVEKGVSLGEGMTPLVSSSTWDAQFKLEYVSPTGSFKDRGATTTISHALACGADRVVEDSSGNGGAAIATYAARAGLDAEIYVPASVREGKLRGIERVGATPIRIEGERQAATDACIEAVESGDAWYASHSWSPAFFAGTATFAYEVALQRDWNVPDAVVMPLGHGTLFLGVYRGFKALSEAGWIDSVPRLLGAQAAGYAPIASELHTVPTSENDVADGVHIREPTRKQQLLDAIAATNGDAIAITEDTVEAELDRLHANGFYVEPTSAIAPAALQEYREQGSLEPDADVVMPLTGHGLKT
ncbi:Pyridoxal-5'-phosphate-dependent protein beta subunit (plasmid) [Haloterrigena turkmenica DSM 5511]|uniref:Pyridoxal-5'-phosphate-dependent protein beta subunit n=1 Tax=Haloterrigena turkmenica (strain ATCC 51198 / DSM 5511 / JCM 9101 / NCIMB 13204 / VKM B-1734 / 4k) TaxID=543526 RepID=D2S2N0_HALTV|nr:pyridoxal-phosphate dependent enzyme [Haloterrigena turkmenica]ADB63627.1 Pyridoxal-5'-phosphate-dependent protein beta subunit [Haloterrigena turkmenica DSM 5511]